MSAPLKDSIIGIEGAVNITIAEIKQNNPKTTYNTILYEIKIFTCFNSGKKGKLSDTKKNNDETSVILNNSFAIGLSPPKIKTLGIKPYGTKNTSK
jgi:hypothetical protein